MINLKNPAELRNAANEFDAKVNEIKDKLDLITQNFNTLFEAWQDKNSVEIQDVLNQIKTTENQIVSKAETMKTVLNNEAAKAEEALARIEARHGNKETINVNQ